MLYGFYRGGFALLLWQFTPWFLVINCMGWILMIFICSGHHCTNMETTPYPTLEACEVNRSAAVDAILAQPSLTFFHTRCEQKVATD